MRDANAATVFWQANLMNPRGQVTQEQLGNGILTNRAYDPATGWLSSIQSGLGGGAGAQNESYLFDLVGNVTQRQNNNQGLTENFYYDNLHRLDYSTLGGNVNLDLSYDAMGNITSRSDVAGGASWTYHATKRHAVTQAGSSSYTYSYDANGNAITRNGYSISWSSYNYPLEINGPGKQLTFTYDAHRQRIQQVYANGSATETTTYVGKLLEKVTVGSLTDWRHYIHAGSRRVAVMSRSSTGSNVTRYILEDHQNSIAHITDNAGANFVSESFTAFGARRDATTWNGGCNCDDLVKMKSVTRKGYTGHDAIGGVSLGLNHMNGRVQDAITGRFLSPDPFVTQPGNTQNYNRYSYVNNNPLSFVDPSGFRDRYLPYNSPSDDVLEGVTVSRSRLDALFDGHGVRQRGRQGGSGGGGLGGGNIANEGTERGPGDTDPTGELGETEVTVEASRLPSLAIPVNLAAALAPFQPSVTTSALEAGSSTTCTRTGSQEQSSYSPMQFVEDTASTMIGMADAISFGLYGKMVEGVGLGSVQQNMAYDAGLYGAAALSGARLLYAGASASIRFAPNITAADAVRTRNSLKGFFSTLGADHPRAYTVNEMMAKYGSEAAVIQAASRTSPALNTAAGALTASSASQLASSGCP